MDAGGEQIACASRVDADATARILAVGDQQICALAGGERLCAHLQGLPARFADDVAEEEDLHSLHAGRRDGSHPHLAISDARVSRITVTLICPG